MSISTRFDIRGKTALVTGCRRVTVNAVAPGYISTDNTEARRNNQVRSEQILARIPAGRWGDLEDFTGPAVFLASEAADYVHGAILLVDTGWMGR